MNRIIKKPEERWREIVFAARDLFLENEYEKTTMEDVIVKVGIAKGTLYHYFDSKDELLDAVVETMVEEYLYEIQSILNKTKGNALDRMRVLITASNVSLEQDKLIEQLHRPGNTTMHLRQLAITFSKLAPLYASVIQQGCREGIFQTDYPLEAAEFLLAGIQFLTDIGLYPWRQEDLIRRKEAIPSLIEAQLKTEKGSFDFLLK